MHTLLKVGGAKRIIRITVSTCTTTPACVMSWFWEKIYGSSLSGGAGKGDFYPPSGGEPGDSKGDGDVPPEGKKWVGFDPTGLERAAKAAKELDQSRE